MKVWLVTAALLLALGQLLTASRIYEVLNWNKSARILVSHSPNSRRPGKRDQELNSTSVEVVWSRRSFLLGRIASSMLRIHGIRERSMYPMRE
jgi:hypothetical protein